MDNMRFICKDSGFKIMGHLMPNLPGATPEIDKEMFSEMIENPLIK